MDLLYGARIDLVTSLKTAPSPHILTYISGRRDSIGYLQAFLERQHSKFIVFSVEEGF